MALIDENVLQFSNYRCQRGDYIIATQITFLYWSNATDYFGMAVNKLYSGLYMYTQEFFPLDTPHTFLRQYDPFLTFDTLGHGALWCSIKM